MAENNNVSVSVSGITPAQTGENWFLLDQSGTFSLDHTVIATVYIVGAGFDGFDGQGWNGAAKDSSGTGDSHAGNGGQGGYVLTLNNIKIQKNEQCPIIIGQSNGDRLTSAVINGVTYRSDSSDKGSIAGGEPGGSGGWVELDGTLHEGDNGKEGVSTPYGVVCSSGGGGIACDGNSNATPATSGGTGAGGGTSHRQSGENAVNYGCGGGGGICGALAKNGDTEYSIPDSPGSLPGGKGKCGCIIISYTAEEKTLVVLKHYKKTCTTHKTCDTTYASSSSHSCCCSDGSFGCGCGSSGKSSGCGCGSSKT